MRLSEEWNVFVDARKSVPVRVEDIPQKLGLEYKEVYLSNEISGMIECTDLRFSIRINASDPKTRKRFTLAHELGHYMLHRHLIGDGLDDDRAYRSTEAGKYHNTHIGPREETEANRFAASLLMPRDLIKRHRDDLHDDTEKMADLFQVSRQSMSIRLSIKYK